MPSNGYRCASGIFVFLWISISISINRVEKLNDIRHTTISLILVVGISHAFFLFLFSLRFRFSARKEHMWVCACDDFFPVEPNQCHGSVWKKSEVGSESEWIVNNLVSHTQHTHSHYSTRECYQSIVFSCSCSIEKITTKKHKQKFAIIQRLCSNRYLPDKKDRIFPLQFNRSRPLTQTKKLLL